jgi:hypothetical protein
VLSREVVEGEQRLAILVQAFDGFLVLRAIVFYEGLARGHRVFLGLGHPDLLEGSLDLGVKALRQLVEHVRGLVYPAPLLTRLGPHLGQSLPKAERAVGDRQFEGDR